MTPSEPLAGLSPFGPRLLTGQINAHLGDQPIMRVGIPHRGGTLVHWATNQCYPSMISASAFWNPKAGQFVIPEHPATMDLDFALDSAGFTAILRWQNRGTQPGMAGIFPWSLAQYVELASCLRPAWWSQPDLCCEAAIAADHEAVQWRIRATATLLEGCLRQVYAWQEAFARGSSARAAANTFSPPVPVIQGRTTDDYLRSLDLTRAVWRRWEPWLAPPALIGIGSVCRRATHDPIEGVLAVVRAIEPHLDKGTRLHLFGVKGDAMSHLKGFACVGSFDSMAWDLGARRAALTEGRSNSMAARTQAMSTWIERADTQLMAA